MREMNINRVPSNVIPVKNDDDQEVVLYWDADCLILKQNGSLINIGREQLDILVDHVQNMQEYLDNVIYDAMAERLSEESDRGAGPKVQ